MIWKSSWYIFKWKNAQYRALPCLELESCQSHPYKNKLNKNWKINNFCLDPSENWGHRSHWQLKIGDLGASRKIQQLRSGRKAAEAINWYKHLNSYFSKFLEVECWLQYKWGEKEWKIHARDHYLQYDSRFVYVNELTIVISKFSVRLLVIFLSFPCIPTAPSRNAYVFGNNKWIVK